jgi:hypothetical protein
VFANTLLEKIKKKKIQYNGKYGTCGQFTGLCWLQKKADYSNKPLVLRQKNSISRNFMSDVTDNKEH